MVEFLVWILIAVAFGFWIASMIRNDLRQLEEELKRDNDLLDVILEQRLSMIRYIYALENRHRTDHLLTSFEEVSFDEHFEHLREGKDIMELFPLEFLPALEKWKEAA